MLPAALMNIWILVYLSWNDYTEHKSWFKWYFLLIKKSIFVKEHYHQFILKKWEVAQVLTHIEDNHLGSQW